MDAISTPGVERVVIMTSAQVGKTEIINNVVGFHVSHDPAPILVLQPTLDMAETWSKDRLSPMLRDTPVLKDRVADPRARDSGNTITHKRFPGGHLTVVGANSAAGLASRPIRVVLADEVDRYPASAGSEGDPLSLAIKRSTTFWNRRVVMVSTPTVKGFSRIEAEWLASDQRRYFVPCAHCGAEQYLQWSGVRWPEGRHAEAMYHCAECGAGWTDAERRQAIARGTWRATAPAGRIVGFHLNELYSPWSSVASVALAFRDAKGNPETLKTWVNTALGETWEEDAERVDAHALAERLEEWDPEDGGRVAPAEVLAVTVGMDLQDDRGELERVGWAVGEESWSLDHKVIYGDPTSESFWDEVEAYLLTPTRREDGVELPVHAAAIDSGHHTSHVYRFVKPRFRRRVYAIKGVAGAGKPVWPKYASKNNKGRVNLFTIGVDTAKDSVYARLKVVAAGPGYCHFPKGRDPVYFEQLTAEVVKTKYIRGFPVRYYDAQGKRNEALDCRVYAYAALVALNVRWGVAQADNARRVPPRPATPTPAPAPQGTPNPRVERDADRPVPPALPPANQPRGRVIRRSAFMR